MAWDEGSDYDLVPVDHDPFEAAAARLRSGVVSAVRHQDPAIGPVGPVGDFVSSIPRGVARSLAEHARLGQRSPFAELEEPETDLPTRQEVMNAVENSGLPKPKGRSGRFGETVGEMMGAPANYLGPGSLSAKTAWNVASGLTSEAGGQLYEGKPSEGVARMLAGWGPAAAERVILAAPIKRATGGRIGTSKPRLNRAYDVPYLAGSSNDNKTVFIDRRVPTKIKVKLANGKGYRVIDPAIPLAIHEQSEHRAMNAGKPYEKAHIENGTADERAWVEAQGLDWKNYEESMNGMLSHIEHEHPKWPPPALYTKPYPHDKALLLKRLARAE